MSKPLTIKVIKDALEQGRRLPDNYRFNRDSFLEVISPEEYRLMSEPKPIWGDPNTAAGTAVENTLVLPLAGLTGYANEERPERPQTVYCCDEMREAAEMGLIDGDEIEYNEIHKGDISTRYFPINFCPFCGKPIEATE